MAMYAIVFKNKDNNQVVLTRDDYGCVCIFSEYTSAAKMLSEVAERLRYLLDGQPQEYGNLLFGYRTVRKTVRNEDKEKWERILKTLEIKRIYDVVFDDNTAVVKTVEGE